MMNPVDSGRSLPSQRPTSLASDPQLKGPQETFQPALGQEIEDPQLRGLAVGLLATKQPWQGFLNADSDQRQQLLTLATGQRYCAPPQDLEQPQNANEVVVVLAQSILGEDQSPSSSQARSLLGGLANWQPELVDQQNLPAWRSALQSANRLPEDQLKAVLQATGTLAQRGILDRDNGPEGLQQLTQWTKNLKSEYGAAEALKFLASTAQSSSSEGSFSEVQSLGRGYLSQIPLADPAQVAALKSRSLHILDSRDGQILRQIDLDHPLEESQGQRLQTNPQGALALTSFGSDLVFWVPPGGERGHLLQHPSPVSQVCLGPQAAITRSEDGTIRRWNAEGELQGSLDQQSTQMALSPDGKHLVAANCQQIQVWDREFAPVRDFSSALGDRQLLGLALSDSTLIVMSQGDGFSQDRYSRGLLRQADPVLLSAWDLASGQPRFQLELDADQPQLALSPDQGKLAIHQQGKVQLLSLETGQVDREIRLANCNSVDFLQPDLLVGESMKNGIPNYTLMPLGANSHPSTVSLPPQAGWLGQPQLSSDGQAIVATRRPGYGYGPGELLVARPQGGLNLEPFAPLAQEVKKSQTWAHFNDMVETFPSEHPLSTPQYLAELKRSLPQEDAFRDSLYQLKSAGPQALETLGDWPSLLLTMAEDFAEHTPKVLKACLGLKLDSPQEARALPTFLASLKRQARGLGYLPDIVDKGLKRVPEAYSRPQFLLNLTAGASNRDEYYRTLLNLNKFPGEPQVGDPWASQSALLKAVAQSDRPLDEVVDLMSRGAQASKKLQRQAELDPSRARLADPAVAEAVQCDLGPEAAYVLEALSNPRLAKSLESEQGLSLLLEPGRLTRTASNFGEHTSPVLEMTGQLLGKVSDWSRPVEQPLRRFEIDFATFLPEPSYAPGQAQAIQALPERYQDLDFLNSLNERIAKNFDLPKDRMNSLYNTCLNLAKGVNDDSPDLPASVTRWQDKQNFLEAVAESKEAPQTVAAFFSENAQSGLKIHRALSQGPLKALAQPDFLEEQTSHLDLPQMHQFQKNLVGRLDSLQSVAKRLPTPRVEQFLQSPLVPNLMQRFRQEAPAAIELCLSFLAANSDLEPEQSQQQLSRLLDNYSTMMKHDLRYSDSVSKALLAVPDHFKELPFLNQLLEQCQDDYDSYNVALKLAKFKGLAQEENPLQARWSHKPSLLEEVSRRPGPVRDVVEDAKKCHSHLAGLWQNGAEEGAWVSRDYLERAQAHLGSRAAGLFGQLDDQPWLNRLRSPWLKESLTHPQVLESLMTSPVTPQEDGVFTWINCLVKLANGPESLRKNLSPELLAQQLQQARPETVQDLKLFKQVVEHVGFDTMAFSGYTFENIARTTFEQPSLPFGKTLVENFENLTTGSNPRSVADLANSVPIHKSLPDSEALQDYGRILLRTSLAHPEVHGRLNHIIGSVKTELDNRDPEGPVISQQNIIMSNSAMPNEEGVASLGWGNMVFQTLGELGDNLEVGSQSDQGHFSPHPDYVPQRLRFSDGRSRNLFVLKEPGKVIEVRRRHPESKEILDSIPIQPIGIDQDYFYVYYRALAEEDRSQAFAICLYMEETKEVFQAAARIDNQPLKDYVAPQLAEAGFADPRERAQKFSQIKSPTAMVEWLNELAPPKEETEVSALVDWQQARKHLEERETQLGPQVSRTAHWLANNLERQQLPPEKRSDTAQRIENSAQAEPFFRVAEALRHSGVLAGNREQNSHYGAIVNLMPELRSRQPKPTFEPKILFVEEGVPQASQALAGSGILKGSELLQAEGPVSEAIHSLLEEGSVLVNGRRLDRENFSNYTLMMGDNLAKA